LSSLLGGSFDGRSLSSEGLLIDLFKNKNATPDHGDSDRAVDWPFYLEVEPLDSEACQPERFIESIAALLKLLRARGVQSAPSCDFEDQLANLN